MPRILARAIRGFSSRPAGSRAASFRSGGTRFEDPVRRNSVAASNCPARPSRVERCSPGILAPPQTTVTQFEAWNVGWEKACADTSSSLRSHRAEDLRARLGTPIGVVPSTTADARRLQWRRSGASRPRRLRSPGRPPKAHDHSKGDHHGAGTEQRCGHRPLRSSSMATLTKRSFVPKGQFGSTTNSPPNQYGSTTKSRALRSGAGRSETRIRTVVQRRTRNRTPMGLQDAECPYGGRSATSNGIPPESPEASIPRPRSDRQYIALLGGGAATAIR